MSPEPAQRPVAPAHGGFPRRGALYAALSAAVLAPCFWQERIQAGDLGSHIYNTWLVHLIRRGQAPGLSLSFQTTNVLFDWLLEAGWRGFGPALAQRFAVGAAVLVFFWGAWNFLSAAAERQRARPPWFLLPILAMLAYGRVFHMGFFNFYLSLGLVAWAMALALRGGRRNWMGGAALAVLAWTAHPLPLLWGAIATAFLLISWRLGDGRRCALTAGALLALYVFREAVVRNFSAKWSPDQAVCMLGADQFWVYTQKYYLVTFCCLCLWGWWAVRLASRRGVARFAVDPHFHLVLIHAAGIFLLPSWIDPGLYRHGLEFLADRMSLAAALLVCALLVSVRPRKVELAVMAGAGALFFGMLFHDTAAVNRFEDRVAAAVRALPPGARVVSAISSATWRTVAVAHTLDRACIGHCFSYANYEPATGQFRVRASDATPLLIPRFRDSLYMQRGEYPMRPQDLPLWVVTYCRSGPEVCVKPVRAGEQFGNTAPRWK